MVPPKAPEAWHVGFGCEFAGRRSVKLSVENMRSRPLQHADGAVDTSGSGSSSLPGRAPPQLPGPHAADPAI
eukprot:CAMPEP_0206149280 /NCGR_PEP_ID=MMETSP1473-20131121/37697_1 /ASSEMBLY_ACC=CAM_ASM_001109 /TAXON_ID=1461547 /ORGANISM="Stichococcus sp, Strain RCC1054" /LENGTH=71 /DNA_ID=CAMNT_0053546735 /DNA_START=1509 /DNA_END=1724 /DNA_ORIENTATION=+